MKPVKPTFERQPLMYPPSGSGVQGRALSPLNENPKYELQRHYGTYRVLARGFLGGVCDRSRCPIGYCRSTRLLPYVPVLLPPLYTY